MKSLPKEMLQVQWKYNQIMVITGTTLYTPLGLAVMVQQGSIDIPILLSYVVLSLMCLTCFVMGFKLKNLELKTHLPLAACFYLSVSHQFIILHVTQAAVPNIIAANMLIFAGMLIMGTLARRDVMIFSTQILIGLITLVWIPSDFPLLAYVLGFLPLLAWAYISAVQRIGTLEDLAESRRRLDQALGNARMTTFSFDLKKKEIRFDQHGPGVLGVSDEGNKLNWARFLSVLDPASSAELLAALERNKKSDATIQRALHRKEGDRFYQIQLSRVENEDETVDRFVGVLWDVTTETLAKKQVEEEQARSEINARLASVGEMASGVAHEINNPLTIILGTSQSLKRTLSALLPLDSPTPEHTKVLQALAKLETTADRIGKIVRGLMRLARDGETDPTAPASLNRIIDDTLELAKQGISSRGIDLRLKIQKDEIFSQCRPTQVGQILLNLLNNARDAVQATPDAWIEIGLRAEDKRVVLSVEDSGTPIPDHVKKRLFEPFFTTKPAGSGTGLGLSISRSLAQSQNGKLELDSDSPHTRFLLSLPIAH